VEWHEYAMAHSVSMEEINDIRTFLLRIMHWDVWKDARGSEFLLK
jgi:hypothetical protein